MSHVVRCLGMIALAASLKGQAEAPGQPAVIARYAVGGTTGWDALTYDERSHRLFVAHGDRVVVLSTEDGRKLGEISGTDGVHAVALAPDIGKGFTSDGKANTVTVFDFATLEVRRRIALHGRKPDAILFDAQSNHVLVFDGASNMVEFIDPVNETLIGSAPLPSNPEFAVSDGQGRVFVNLEDSHSLALIDSKTEKLMTVAPLPDCDGPTGIAFDPEYRLVFSACQNRRMTVFDVAAGKVTGSLPIGEHPDGAAFDASHRRVYASNGAGTLSIFDVKDGARFTPVAEVATQSSARTMALDAVHQQVYLPAAEFGPPPPPTAEAPHPRGAIKPDSFVILVVH